MKQKNQSSSYSFFVYCIMVRYEQLALGYWLDTQIITILT